MSERMYSIDEVKKLMRTAWEAGAFWRGHACRSPLGAIVDGPPAAEMQERVARLLRNESKS